MLKSSMLGAQLLPQSLCIVTKLQRQAIPRSLNTPTSSTSESPIGASSPSARQFSSTSFLRRLPLLLDEAIDMLQSNPKRFCEAIQERKIPLVEAELIAKNIVNEMRFLAIPDEGVRIALAKFVAVHSPLSLAHNLVKFNIPRDDVLMDIFPRVYREDIRRNEEQHNYPATLLSSASDIAERFFPYDKSLQKKALFEGISSLPHIHPPFLAMMQNAMNERDPHVNNILTHWAHFTCLAFRNLQLSEQAWLDLELSVNAIRQFHVPALRKEITEELARHYCGSQRDLDAKEFRTFYKDYSKPHMHIFAPFLFTLCSERRRRGEDYPVIKQLSALLKRQEFKDTKRQARVINGLRQLMSSNRIDHDQRQQLIQAITPGRIDKQAVFVFLHSLQGISGLLSLSERQTPFGAHILDLVLKIHTMADLQNTLGIVYSELFGVDKNDNYPGVIAKFDHYLAQSRQPTALLQYASKVMNELTGEEQKSMMAAMHKFVRASVLSNDSNEFKRVRYDTTHSNHMRVIAEKSPEVYALWQQSHPYKMNDDDASNVNASELMSPSSREATTPKLTVIDSDAPEDLLLCASELSGSCIGIHGEIRHAKALLAYVLDGKYRLIAAKAPDGRLGARRILRLMWNDKEQRPVLHLEILYKDPGVSPEIENVMIDLARQKASSLGCPLVTNDKAVPTIGLYPSPILSLGGQTPFEYVDATGFNHAISGQEPYELSNVRVVGGAT